MLVYKYISKADDDYYDNQAPCIVFPTIWVILMMMMKMKITLYCFSSTLNGCGFSSVTSMHCKLWMYLKYRRFAIYNPQVGKYWWQNSRLWGAHSIVKTRLTLEGRTWWYVFPRLQSLPPIIDHIIDKKSRLYLWYHKMMVPMLGSLWTYQGK